MKEWKEGECTLYLTLVVSRAFTSAQMYITLSYHQNREAFCSAFKNDVILVYHWSLKTIYWTVISNLVCILAYHWSFVLNDVIFL